MFSIACPAVVNVGYLLHRLLPIFVHDDDQSLYSQSNSNLYQPSKNYHKKLIPKWVSKHPQTAS